jgi:hypothetical protein
VPIKLTAVSTLLALLATGTLSAGQASAAPRSRPFPHFTQKEGKLDADGLPTSGATLCVFDGRNVCFEMPPKEGSKNLTYEFGLEPHSERLPLADGSSWVFFTAMFSGGGSGTLTRFAVLRYSYDGKIENLLPWVGVTNVSQYAMWSLPEVSPYPMLILADFVWGKGESHFDRHFYNVSVWKFDPKFDHYFQAIEYRTAQKYSSGDDDRIRVLGLERQEITRRLELK